MLLMMKIKRMPYFFVREGIDGTGMRIICPVRYSHLMFTIRKSLHMDLESLFHFSPMDTLLIRTASTGKSNDARGASPPEDRRSFRGSRLAGPGL